MGSKHLWAAAFLFVIREGRCGAWGVIDREWGKPHLLKNMVHFLSVTVSYYITHLEWIQGELR